MRFFYLLAVSIVLGLLFSTTAAGAQDSAPTADDLGTVIPLSMGVLFVPDAFVFDDEDESIDLLVHFHLGLNILARAIDEQSLNVVMIHISPGGFSSAYRVPFEDEALFGVLLNEALEHLRSRSDIAMDADWRRINISSFSAGYGAVRELLKRDEEVARIDGLALCDTIYAGYIEREGVKIPNPDQVAPFIAFARLAAEDDNEKTMVVTHSYLEPGTYAGTHETAQAIIDAVGAEDRSVDEDGPGSLHLLRRASLNGFEVFGAEGKDGAAHVKHLQTIGHWLAMLDWGD